MCTDSMQEKTTIDTREQTDRTNSKEQRRRRRRLWGPALPGRRSPSRWHAPEGGPWPGPSGLTSQPTLGPSPSRTPCRRSGQGRRPSTSPPVMSGAEVGLWEGEGTRGEEEIYAVGISGQLLGLLCVFERLYKALRSAGGARSLARKEQKTTTYEWSEQRDPRSQTQTDDSQSPRAPTVRTSIRQHCCCCCCCPSQSPGTGFDVFVRFETPASCTKARRHPDPRQL